MYEAFKDHARAIKGTGRKKYSAWVIVQVIRWARDTQTTGEVFRINNDFIALYARMFMSEHPEFDGFLELRVMKPVRKLSAEDAARQGVGQNPYQGPGLP